MDKKELIDKIQESRAKREVLLKRLGAIPLSVLGPSLVPKTWLDDVVLIYQRFYPGQSHLQKKTVFRDRKTGKTVMSYVRVSGKSQLTIFPPRLVKLFLEIYTQPGDVYLDPFAGQMVRAQVAAFTGRKYYGMDLSKQFVGFWKEIVHPYLAERGLDKDVHVFWGDSRKPDPGIPQGIGDFCLTSPPYWDMEFYGDEPGQLGKAKTWEEFIDGLVSIFKAWHPLFKPGAYVLINVGDVRRKGRDYPYAAYLTVAMEKTGLYQFWDMWILDRVVKATQVIYAVNLVSKRRAPRVHEYVMVFRAK